MKTLKNLALLILVLVISISCQKETVVESPVSEKTETLNPIHPLSITEFKSTITQPILEGDWKLEFIYDSENRKWNSAVTVDRDFFPAPFINGTQVLRVASPEVTLSRPLLGELTDIIKFDIEVTSNNSILVGDQDNSFNFKVYSFYNGKALLIVGVDEEGNRVSRYHWFVKQ
ncbi:hypothetical protein NBT05_00605 [Aquimarina sp. ERC-38]|uniref:hypothetical protein n=1 Tax=Aquimarina sp. ERC-38 TaxID=2949996 RepID=UPI0022461E60|nr:hypothetical protein [Aquimarina sp. ERC-38]UZO80996.1 hypothetical protein NBT05_00605 [Aquimarina sp. ERC-38]